MANYVSTLTGPQMDAALLDMAEHNSEAWAVGTRDGSAVSSADVTYHNNAEYYATNAQSAAARAEAAVPPSTAGAVFFDRVQSLTDAQKTRARTNIGAQSNNGGVVQLGDYVAVGQAMIPALPNATVGWYRIASIDATGLATSAYKQIFVMSGGAYASGTPSEFAVVASLPTYSSNANARVTQLSGAIGGNYNRIRFGQDGYIVHVEVYLATTGSGSRGSQVFTVMSIGGALTTFTPTAPISTTPANIIIDFPLQTTITGAVNTILQARGHVTGISSMAALKNQLSTWYAAQGAGSLGYYTMATSGTISPITPTSASLGVEIRAGATANYGTAVLTSHSTAGAAMFIMALNNGTWTDPVKLS